MRRPTVLRVDLELPVTSSTTKLLNHVPQTLKPSNRITNSPETRLLIMVIPRKLHFFIAFIGITARSYINTY